MPTIPALMSFSRLKGQMISRTRICWMTQRQSSPGLIKLCLHTRQCANLKMNQTFREKDLLHLGVQSQIHKRSLNRKNSLSQAISKSVNISSMTIFLKKISSLSLFLISKSKLHREVKMINLRLMKNIKKNRWMMSSFNTFLK